MIAASRYTRYHKTTVDWAFRMLEDEDGNRQRAALIVIEARRGRLHHGVGKRLTMAAIRMMSKELLATSGPYLTMTAMTLLATLPYSAGNPHPEEWERILAPVLEHGHREALLIIPLLVQHRFPGTPQAKRVLFACLKLRIDGLHQRAETALDWTPMGPIDHRLIRALLDDPLGPMRSWGLRTLARAHGGQLPESTLSLLLPLLEGANKSMPFPFTTWTRPIGSPEHDYHRGLLCAPTLPSGVEKKIRKISIEDGESMGLWGYSILAHFGRLQTRDLDHLRQRLAPMSMYSEVSIREVLLDQHLAAGDEQDAAAQVDRLLELGSPMIGRRARELDLNPAQHRLALLNLLKKLRYDNPLDDSIPRANPHWLPLKPKLNLLLRRAELRARRKKPGWYEAQVRAEIFRKMHEDLEAQTTEAGK